MSIRYDRFGQDISDLRVGDFVTYEVVQRDPEAGEYGPSRYVGDIVAIGGDPYPLRILNRPPDRAHAHSVRYRDILYRLPASTNVDDLIAWLES